MGCNQCHSNVLDHLLFAPLQTVAFPLADNIWWLSQLWLSLICARLWTDPIRKSLLRMDGWQYIDLMRFFI